MESAAPGSGRSHFSGAWGPVPEPGNYVALREIQPWLIFLKDRVEDGGGQCILISHHPEMIHYLAAGYGRLSFRNGQGMLDVKRFEPDSENLILPAELIAQGWE